MSLQSYPLASITTTLTAVLCLSACSGGDDSVESVAELSEEIRNGTVVTPWGSDSAPTITKSIVSLGGCTGTVVRPSWVLTAKHCLTEVGAQVVSVRPTGNVSRTVDVVVPNPDPGRDTLMLHLSSPFTDIPHHPLMYTQRTENIVGKTVSCYGYGYKATGAACSAQNPCVAGQECTSLGVCMTPSAELRTADLVAETYFTDSYANPDIFATPANSASQNILKGDSGGPCFLEGSLVGVNSFGGVAWGAQASVPASRDWITAPSRVMYTAGDFNGDGKKDVVITIASGSYWYFSTGAGTWSVPYERADLPLGKVMYTPGDFNGDGKTDLIITTGTGSEWYYSTGTGTWTVGYARADLPFHSVAYVAADFNGDSKSDVIVTTPNGSDWLYSTGTGTWNAAYSRSDLKMSVVAYVPGDFNGDGKKDLIVTTPAGSTWLYSTGTGTFNAYFSRSDLPLQAAAFVPGDFNGDGRTDFIISTAGGSYWYYPTAAGTWDMAYQRTNLPLGSVAYVPGDFNGDGKTDVIISNYSGSYWYYSAGTGLWSEGFRRTDLRWRATLYTPLDFSGDGKSDLIISNASGSYWYHSTGTGTWAETNARPDLPM